MTKNEYHKPDVWDRLWPILYERNRNDIIYVYRVGPENIPVKPHLLKSGTYPDLIECLQHTHGTGRYRLLIRRARKMILSGNINIG